jgi:TolB-like protein
MTSSATRLWTLVCISVGLFFGAVLPIAAQTKGLERPFDKDALKVITGEWEFSADTKSVKGKIFDNWAEIDAFDDQAATTFDLRGTSYDWFIGYLGVADDDEPRTGTIYLESEDETLLTLKFTRGQPAQAFKVPLTGRKSLTIRRTTKGGCFFEPKLIKGTPAPAPASQPVTPAGTLVAPAAPFVVDPGDIEKLATALRKRVEAKAELKEKVATGFIAVMTFNLIDIPSPSIAQNIAEDFSTKLINAEFQLVERGQLDKALKELKIHDSALVDQATAKKLGQLTGCTYILVGSVSDRGQFIVINARILETATGKALVAESVECRKIPIQR